MKIFGFAGFSGSGMTTPIIVGGVVSLRDKLAWFHPQ